MPRRRSVTALRRLTVTGTSMHPTFLPGDRLLIAHPTLLRPLESKFKRVRPGDVVAFYDPRQPPGSPSRRLMLKRVHGRRHGALDLRGDNPGASTDSRHFGAVAVADIVGIVVYRYYPAQRVAWWPGSTEKGSPSGGDASHQPLGG
ncbi:MAG: nickel-type superoxide dismutase maturation protease [Acidimicrobiales bacterium]